MAVAASASGGRSLSREACGRDKARAGCAGRLCMLGCSGLAAPPETAVDKMRRQLKLVVRAMMHQL
jgi:hypothetical protein